VEHLCQGILMSSFEFASHVAFLRDMVSLKHVEQEP